MCTKIGILNEYDITTRTGGGALVNDRIKNELESSGIAVDVILKNEAVNHLQNIDIDDYALFIFANISKYSAKELLPLAHEKPFVMLRHDLPFFIYRQPPSVFHDEIHKLYSELFERASSSILISPMQKEVFSRFYNITNPVVLPPPLDVSSFSNENRASRSGNLYIGDISSGRGVVETIEIMDKFMPNETKTFAGPVIEPDLIKIIKAAGAEYIGVVPHQDVPALMNSHKSFYYFPKIYDSFCLKILEADLCGMKIYADYPRIGIFSYKRSFTELAEDVNRNSIETIVKTIKGIVKQCDS